MCQMMKYEVMRKVEKILKVWEKNLETRRGNCLRSCWNCFAEMWEFLVGEINMRGNAIVKRK